MEKKTNKQKDKRKKKKHFLLNELASCDCVTKTAKKSLN